MSETYTWSFSKQFAKEFRNFPVDQQDKILEFTELFEEHGLSGEKFCCYPGKITYSWKGLDSEDENYKYAKGNDLWHYHIGIPTYVTRHDTYQTSDWVLHFQWTWDSSHLDIVDVYKHYTMDGKFYLPPESSLRDAS
ncbi:MAG: hypothetical protein ACTIOJ_05915 [Hafnia alvei]|uniref:hypothetical protein n=1 Tax=Hafnia alvei TaxID=569 RepID=UPI003F99B661